MIVEVRLESCGLGRQEDRKLLQGATATQPRLVQHAVRPMGDCKLY